MNLFQNVIQKIKTPSTFVKSVFALSSASVITQIMPIFTAPILTRIYEPADYGILGMVMVITGLIGVIITLGYTNAIIIADDNDEAEKVSALCLKIFLSTVIVTTIATIFCGALGAMANAIRPNGLGGSPDFNSFQVLPASVLFHIPLPFPPELNA